MPDEIAVNIVANTFNQNNNVTSIVQQQANLNYYLTFNPIDKLVKLYGRML